MKRNILIIILLMSILNNCSGLLSIVRERVPPPHPVEGGILFQLEYEGANSVQLVGSFNGWAQNVNGRIDDPEIGKMTRDPETGIWKRVQKLEPGRHIYKFAIDGGKTWIPDPSNKNKDENDDNSLIIVD